MDLWQNAENADSVTFDDNLCLAHSTAYYCQPVETTPVVVTTQAPPQAPTGTPACDVHNLQVGAKVKMLKGDEEDEDHEVPEGALGTIACFTGQGRPGICYSNWTDGHNNVDSCSNNFATQTTSCTENNMWFSRNEYLECQPTNLCYRDLVDISYDTSQSGGSFTYADDTVTTTGQFASVLFPLAGLTGKVYLEFTRTGNTWGAYTGVQRAPQKVGNYHDKCENSNGNCGESARFADTDLVEAPAINTMLIDLDTSTVTVNGVEKTVAGSGDLWFGVYDGTSGGTGSVTINWGKTWFNGEMPSGAQAWACQGEAAAPAPAAAAAAAATDSGGDSGGACTNPTEESPCKSGESNYDVMLKANPGMPYSYYDGAWYPVCSASPNGPPQLEDSDPPSYSAELFCKKLGFSTGVIACADMDNNMVDCEEDSMGRALQVELPENALIMGMCSQPEGDTEWPCTAENPLGEEKEKCVIGEPAPCARGRPMRNGDCTAGMEHGTKFLCS